MRLGCFAGELIAVLGIEEVFKEFFFGKFLLDLEVIFSKKSAK